MQKSLEREPRGDMLVHVGAVFLASIALLECKPVPPESAGRSEVVRGDASSAKASPCIAQDARFEGAYARSCCQEETRWRWNGTRCEVFWVVEPCHCSHCSGIDCDHLYADETRCRDAHAGCGD
jgi:hypothetical protein